MLYKVPFKLVTRVQRWVLFVGCLSGLLLTLGIFIAGSISDGEAPPLDLFIGAPALITFIFGTSTLIVLRFHRQFLEVFNGQVRAKPWRTPGVVLNLNEISSLSIVDARRVVASNFYTTNSTSSFCLVANTRNRAVPLLYTDKTKRGLEYLQWVSSQLNSVGLKLTGGNAFVAPEGVVKNGILGVNTTKAAKNIKVTVVTYGKLSDTAARQKQVAISMLVFTVSLSAYYTTRVGISFIGVLGAAILTGVIIGLVLRWYQSRPQEGVVWKSLATSLDTVSHAALLTTTGTLVLTEKVLLFKTGLGSDAAGWQIDLGSLSEAIFTVNGKNCEVEFVDNAGNTAKLIISNWEKLKQALER